MKKLNFILIILLAAFVQNAAAQEKLTLQQAITIALQNNYDIKLVNNDLQIAKNNTNIGNAGFYLGLQGVLQRTGVDKIQYKPLLLVLRELPMVLGIQA
ncbi:hypothetical protein [Pedobacter panaciterrae]